MSQTIEQLRASLRTRLQELDRERSALTAALEALDSGASAAPAPAKPPRPARRRPRAPQAPAAERMEQVMQIVQAEPGVTQSEVGRRLGIHGSRVAQLADMLREQGRLAPGQRGQGLRPAWPPL